ncbi:hypothetical protein D8B26_007145 [Coccidioides posadasii str. Silveira]|uniref:uncharacterized protein n=1 Tax=Coccidioides posadasii (strain RMSCC 757 / Silveira) TaxID=443226 RepID=UPI001BEEA81D|nr:hypothetical protein D8B26_007145 [Coccidioides posadasii str. Silveira]
MEHTMMLSVVASMPREKKKKKKKESSATGRCLSWCGFACVCVFGGGGVSFFFLVPVSVLSPEKCPGTVLKEGIQNNLGLMGQFAAFLRWVMVMRLWREKRRGEKRREEEHRSFYRYNLLFITTLGGRLKSTLKCYCKQNLLWMFSNYLDKKHVS